MENITLNGAIQSLANKRAKDALENLALYDGKHLHLEVENSFKGYIGLLPPGNALDYGFVTEWLGRIFAAANLVKAGVARNLDAVLSRDPDSTLVFPESFADTIKDALETETTAAFNDWWDEKDFLKNILRETGKTVLLESEVYLRPIIPFLQRNAQGKVSKKNLSEAFDLVDFEIVTADKGGVFTNEQTGQKYSICYIQTKGSKEVEISYVKDDGLTYLRILRDDDLKKWSQLNFAELSKYIDENPDAEKETSGIDLGGRLFLHKITRDQLITEPARSLQRSVNYSLTTMNKNLNIAGSRETGYGNTQRPKKKVVTKNSEGTVMSVIEEDAPLVKGAHNANFFTGIPIYSETQKDAAGNPILIDYKDPKQFVVDPVAVDTFVKAFEVYRELFLEEIYQAHILGSNLTISGKSKQESRSDFEKSAKATRIAMNSAGRYVLEILLKLGASFCGRSAEFRGVRVNFKCQITVGALGADELAQAAQDVKDGFDTLYNYIVKRGEEDPDAVIAQLKSADDFVLKQIEQVLKINTESPAIPLEVLIDYLPIGDEDKKTLKAAIKPAENPL